MATVTKTVNFGSTRAGLSTVGYQLKNAAGANVGSRVTAGVYETGGGGYGAAVTTGTGSILWDTGEATPLYVSDDQPRDPTDSPGVTSLLTAIGAPAGASLAADVAGIKAEADTLLTRIPDADLSTMADRFLTMVQLSGSAYVFTAPAVALAPAAAGGLGLQDIRDAMTLAPTLAAASNSVDYKLDAAIATGSSGSSGTGDGDTPVNHNTGGTDAMRITFAGAGADNVRINAYLKSEYDAGSFALRGITYTGPDGRWLEPLMLNSNVTYSLVFQIPGTTQAKVTELLVP